MRKPDSERRFALSVLLALVLHGAVLFVIRIPAMHPVSGQRHVLEVELVARHKLESPPSQVPKPVPEAGGSSRMRPGDPTRAWQTTLIPADDSAAVPAVAEATPTINAGRLLESARQFARDEAKQTERGKVAEDHNPNTQEMLIAKVLGRPAAGEESFGNGVRKITTTGGASYCLKAPDFVPDGPGGAPLAVPTTCP